MGGEKLKGKGGWFFGDIHKISRRVKSQMPHFIDCLPIIPDQASLRRGRLGTARSTPRMTKPRPHAPFVCRSFPAKISAFQFFSIFPYISFTGCTVQLPLFRASFTVIWGDGRLDIKCCFSSQPRTRNPK